MNWNNLELPDRPYYQGDAVVIYHADCRDILPLIPDKSIDLVLTSPPYDDLREYGGYGFEFEGIAPLILGRMKVGSVLVWVVGDQVVNGSETGSSFRQALYFKDLGLNLYDTMIYQKNNCSLPDPSRYFQVFEYMFVFSKGKPKVFNPIEDKPRRWFGKSGLTKKRATSGEIEFYRRDPSVISNKRGNIWIYDVGYGKGSTDKITFQHPATFPEKLARDHIISWSNQGDLVMDPMLGSGTVAKIAKKLNRKCIGIEIEEKYCEIAANRCRQMVMNLNNREDRNER